MTHQPPDCPPPTNPRLTSLGTFSIIHDYMISNFILLYFNARTLDELSKVSKPFYFLSRDDQLWRRLCLLRWGDTPTGISFKSTWRITYFFPEANDEYDKLGLHHNLSFISGYHSEYLYYKWCRCHMDLKGFGNTDPTAITFPYDEEIDNLEEFPNLTISKVRGEDLNAEKFRSEYDEECLPVMITGGDYFKHWKALNWSKDLLEKYPDVMFRVGNEYGGPKKVNMTLRDYYDYMKRQNDEAPLYIFDGKFGDKCPDMLNDYDVPKIFKEDFFSVLENTRPAFRWIVIGPSRSGASWHIDPQGTSAWNVLLSGRKRWALYPPDMLPPGVTINDSGHFESPTSLHWYLEIYPSLSQRYKPIEIVQETGEMIFVPGGWWHMVLNLDEINIAVTQNFVGRANLPAVCRDFVESNQDKKFLLFRSKLLPLYPDLEPVFTDAMNMFKPTEDKVIKSEGYNSKAEFMESFEIIYNANYGWGERLCEIVTRHPEIYGEQNDLQTFLEGFEKTDNGQNPVYIHKKSKTIIKVYLHSTGGLAAYTTEVLSLKKFQESSYISEITPNLLAHGFYSAKNDSYTLVNNSTTTTEISVHRPPTMIPWPWPYTITTYFEKQMSLNEAMPTLTEFNWNETIIPWIAKTVVNIHELKRDGSVRTVDADIFANLHNVLYAAIPSVENEEKRVEIIKSFPATLFRSDFERYITSRLKFAVAAHKKWGHLSAGLQTELATYLPKSLAEIWEVDGENATTAYVLHGDLNFENILGERDAVTKEFTPKYLIDFGDSFHALPNDGKVLLDPVWDFVGVFVAIFSCDFGKFSLFWSKYWGFRGKLDYKFNNGIRKRIIVYLLLAEFEGVVRWAAKVKPGIWGLNSFKEVEESLFSIKQ